MKKPKEFSLFIFTSISLLWITIPVIILCTIEFSTFMWILFETVSALMPDADF